MRAIITLKIYLKFSLFRYFPKVLHPGDNTEKGQNRKVFQFLNFATSNKPSIRCHLNNVKILKVTQRSFPRISNNKQPKQPRLPQLPTCSVPKSNVLLRRCFYLKNIGNSFSANNERASLLVRTEHLLLAEVLFCGCLCGIRVNL